MTEPTPPASAPSPAVVSPAEVVARTGGPGGTALTALAALCVGLLLVVTVAGREVHAAPVWLAVPVLLLPYLYAACAAGLFTVWTALPDRRLPPGLLVVVLCVGAALWGPGWAARGAGETAGEPLRVLSWNVRRLWGGNDDDGAPLACAVRAIEAADPDVITLLEVSRRDLDALSAELGLTCVHATYAGSTRMEHGGLASCVRGENWTLRSGGPQRFTDDVAWFYVSAEVERRGRVVNLLAVHLRPYHLRGLDPARFGLRAATELQETYRSQGDQSAALLHRVERF
ncbi:MAG: hypothetical protein ACI8PZ_002597, partial [Myxococcota bacterium]